MNYSVLDTANELMLDEEILEEIFTSFFDEVNQILDHNQRKLEIGEPIDWKRILHSLKGLASNLHMYELVNLILHLEKEDISTMQDEFLLRIKCLKQSINHLKQIIDTHYKKD